MDKPFVKVSSYSPFAYVDKKNLLAISERMSQLGLVNQVMKLPKYNIGTDNLFKVGKEKQLLTLEEFLTAEQEPESALFMAENEVKTESVAIIFRNKADSSFAFDDNFFPVFKKGENVKIRVSTFDPARTYGLSSFFCDFLKATELKPFFRNSLLVVTGALATLLLVTLFYFKPHYNLSDLEFSAPLLVILGVIVFLLQFMPRSGLRIVAKEKKFPNILTPFRNGGWLYLLIGSVVLPLFVTALYNWIVKNGPILFDKLRSF